MHLQCYICDRDSKLIMELENVSVYKCNQCGHFFSSASEKPISEVYSQTYFEEQHKNWFENPDYGLFKIIEKAISINGKLDQAIIDIGCGNGAFLKYLHSEGYTSLSGIDLIDNEHPEIQFISDDFNKYKPTKQFDVVTSIANIEHIKDVNSYLEKVKLLSKSNTLFIIYTIDENGLLFFLSKILYKIGIRFAAERLYDLHHVNHFSKASLANLIKNKGFSIQSVLKRNTPLKSTDIGGGIIRSLIIIPAFFFINMFTNLTGMQSLQVVFARPVSKITG